MFSVAFLSSFFSPFFAKELLRLSPKKSRILSNFYSASFFCSRILPPSSRSLLIFFSFFPLLWIFYFFLRKIWHAGLKFSSVDSLFHLPPSNSWLHSILTESIALITLLVELLAGFYFNFWHNSP